jgi:hypothetical protein
VARGSRRADVPGAGKPRGAAERIGQGYVSLSWRDATLVHGQDPVGKARGKLRLMQRAQDCHAARMRNLAHERQDGDGRFRIEAGDRLVGEQDPAFLCQRPRDCDALLLPSRQRVGTLMPMIGQSDRFRSGASSAGMLRDERASPGVDEQPAVRYAAINSNEARPTSRRSWGRNRSDACTA